MEEEKAKKEQGQNKERILKITIVILSVLVVALSIFIIYDKVIKKEYKPNTPVNNEIEDKKENNKEENENQKEQEPTEKEEDENFLITAEEKEEVGTKVDVILSITSDGRTEIKDNNGTFVTETYKFNESKRTQDTAFYRELLNSLYLNDEQKRYIALNIAEQKKVSIPASQIDPAIASHFSEFQSQVDEQEVEMIYENYFGTKMEHATTIGWTCKMGFYDSINHKYYLAQQCGAGPTLFYTYTYKYGYTKVDQDTIFVKLAIAYGSSSDLPNNEHNELYDIYKDKARKQFLYQKGVVGTAFEINDSNRNEFTTYLFIFKRNKKGDFSFESIRKIADN